MPSPADRRLTSGTVFLVLFCLMMLAGCRSPEPPAVDTKIGRQEIAPTSPPAPADAAVVQHEPLPVAAKPAPLVPDEKPPAGRTLPLHIPLHVPQKEKIPQIAIIIDDMGYHLQLGHQLLQLALPLTFAFLPEAPHTPEQAKTAYRAGRDILVHLPMEPKEKAWNPGKDALMVEDSAEKIRLKTVRMLAAVPHATGVNNHMGSRFTEVGAGMQVVMETLKTHSFFYIDSFTTKSSRGLATARQQGVPHARRHIFLDNVQEKEAICHRFGLLVDLAKTQGHAIGIGHPNQAMLTALTQCGEVSFRGMELVGAHRLAR